MTQRPSRADLPSVELMLPHDRAAIPLARNSIMSFVACAATGLEDRVALAVSELATNAVIHTDDIFSLRATCNDERCLVEVIDTETEPPRHIAAHAMAECGHGVELVDAVADRWGITPAEHGKTVWAVFDAVEGAGPEDAAGPEEG